MAPRPCPAPGCGRPVEGGGYCEACAPRRLAERQRDLDRRRGSAASRGYGAKWAKARAAFLAAHPLCECDQCKAGELRTMAAQVVDHIVPHRGDMALFWDRSNWQAMSKSCHDRKTAAEDGGFGNAACPRTD